MFTHVITGWKTQNNDFSSSSPSSNNQQEAPAPTVTFPLGFGNHEVWCNPFRPFGFWVSTDPLKIRVHEIPFDEEHKLIRNEPTRLDVRKSECGQYLTINSEDLDTSLSEESLEDLEDAFEAVLALTWEVFVMGDPSEMDKGALEIRERLLAAYCLVTVA